ncbi:MAG: hypothetical protein ACLQVD_01400 [Capsulimonadaceae bacterium]
MSVAIPIYVREDINTDMRRVVEDRGVSINQFVNEAIEARLKAIRDEEWRRDLEAACADDPNPDMEWVEFAMSQTEAILVEHEKS